VVIPASPLAPIKIVFQIGIGSGDVDDVLKGRGMERGSAQVGMDHHSGCIDDAPEARLHLKIDLLLEERVKVFQGEEAVFVSYERFFREKFLANVFQPFSDALYYNGPGMDI
jgi:hypothetical protein